MGWFLAGKGLIDCGSVDVDFSDDTLYGSYNPGDNWPRVERVKINFLAYTRL